MMQQPTITRLTIGDAGSRSGVALVIVLGLLTVLTILAVAFSIAMRFEQFSARHYTDEVRARHYLHVGIVRAMEHVGNEMAEAHYPYPFWQDSAPAAYGHAYASRGAGAQVDLFTGDVTNYIPASLWQDATNVQPTWAYIIGKDPKTGSVTSTNGRLAFLVINASGLIDANSCHAETNGITMTDPGGVALDLLPDVSDPLRFTEDRDLHRSYATVGELAALNRGLCTSISNLFVYSYDPNPGRYLIDADQLGTRDAPVTNRFPINSLTNYATYTEPSFSNEYLLPLMSLLQDANVTNPAPVAWNIVNFLDPDRVPYTATPFPWRENYGGEAVPLINEITLQRVTDSTPPKSNEYAFAVETWYPFAREFDVTAGYTLQVGVFSNFVSDVPEVDIMEHAEPAWSFEIPIESVDAGGTGTFFVATSPAAKRISFPVSITLPGFGGAPSTQQTRYLPIGAATYTTFTALGAPVQNMVTNRVWFLARVLQGPDRNPVDEAMGYGANQPEGHYHALKEFGDTDAYSVDDPRLNGRTTYWAAATNSLGTTNVTATHNQTVLTQGIPVYHADKAISNIVDIGQVFHDGTAPWHTLDLLNSTNGAASLLDTLTTDAPSTNAPWQHGRVNLNTRNPYVLRAIMGPPEIEQPTTTGTNRLTVTEDALNSVVSALISNTNAWPYHSFKDIFSGDPDGGIVADALRACVPTNAGSATDYQREYFLRPLTRKATFRQNILIIILRTEALSADGHGVLAERRAVVTIYRDAFTGKWFIKQFAELE